MTVGPDGALYLVDYYRQMIEHPEWMSSHVHDHSQQTNAGQDRGRIWRIRPAGRPRTPAPRVRLGAASDEELVNALSEPNLWWRRTAQRLIVDGKRESAIEPLQRMLRMTASPVARVHALYTLDGLGALSDELVDSALRDPEAGVREIGIRLAEARLARSPALAAALLGLVDDPSPKVRFQLLLTLGSVSSTRARAAQDRLLLRDLPDPWVQVAALSASPVRAAELLTTALQPRSPFAAQASEGRAAFYRLLGATVGARPSPADFARALRAGGGGGPEWWRAALLEGLARGTSSRSAFGLRPEEEALLAGLAESEAPALRRSALDILQRSEGPRGPSIVSRAERARALARDPTAVAERRADAVRLLALAGGSEDLQLLVALTDERQPPVVQAAAVRAMSRVATEETGSILIARWRRLAPPARSAAADFLLQAPKTTRLLVDALRRGEVPTWTLSFWQKRDLIMNTDPGIRADARPLLEEPPGGREAVRERYEAALDLEGDPARGERVFTEVCSKCHRAKGKGQEVGPDLGSVRQRAPALLLGDILLPSRAIAQNYEAYVVETDAGDTHVGVVASQSPTAVMLRREGGAETLVARDRIVKMYASDLSSMPADLEQQVDLQEMADLLAFIRSPP
jgi:putative heme-binding domain-containing protein